MTKWPLAIAALIGCSLLLYGCGGSINPRPPFPTPRPTPTPTPTPAPTPIPACLPEVPWCSDLTPPATCSSATVPCKHNPSQDPYHCELAPACPKPPDPEPPKPTPPPGGVNCDGEPGKNTGQRLSTHASTVDEAMKLLTGCEIGSECLLGDKSLQVWAREVIAVVRRAGKCAGQHEPGITDEIAVANNAAAMRESYKVGAGDDGSGAVPPGGARRTVVWSRGGVREAWTAGAGPEPPSAEGCTAPVTPKVNKFALRAWQRTNDSTPQFYNRETERWDGTKVTGYCDAIGFEDRLDCPARMECGDVVNPRAIKCHERMPCEALGVSGRVDGKPLWRSDGEVHLTDNPFQATCAKCTWLEICAGDATKCQRCAINPATGLCF